MTEKQFIDQLDKHLKRLSLGERRDILNDYKEHFAMGLAEGKTEESIAEALGSPTKIAEELLASYSVKETNGATSTGNVVRAVWAGIGLVFFNLVIVLGPFFGLVGLVIAGWSIGVSFALTPLLIVVERLFFTESIVPFELFMSLILSGIGIFVVMGMYPATRGFIHLTIKYVRFNVAFVKGGASRA